VNIILFGPPGAGKGTQGDNLVKKFNLIKISAGDLLRQEINKNNQTGIKLKDTIDKGNLVDDTIINDLINRVISNKKYFNKMIFDGYPRNIPQIKYLDESLIKNNQKISCVININVDYDVMVKRILGRQLCSNCGCIFNKYYNPPNANNHKCDSKYLEIRSDDNEVTVKKRFDTYKSQTLPVIEHYRKESLLLEVNGMNEISSIYKEISDFIGRL